MPHELQTNFMSATGKWPLGLAFLSGIIAVFGFAPFELLPLPVMSLALLFYLWRMSATPVRCAILGFTWGLGCFLGGVSWVYVSMHDVGGLAAPLAALATLLFCAFLALMPALAGWAYGHGHNVYGRNGYGSVGQGRSLYGDIALLAGLWTLTEWLRGWLFTGFPWLAIGYSQTPPSPLAGFVPLVGVYGLGFLLALLAAAWALAWRRPLVWGLSLGLLVAGFGLRNVAWTEPVGEPLSVSLLQGNIAQSLKWQPELLVLSFSTYLRLADEHPAQLTVLPETALPTLFERVPSSYLERLTAHGDVLLGSAVAKGESAYANGAVAVGTDLNVRRYEKVHLVPFGEYAPPGFAWFFDWVAIPMSGFTPGQPDQPPLQLAGQRVMPNICYEDLFGEEIRRSVAEATLLINLSNTAWFGNSLAQPQHLQIARVRALESGRQILRATNTGMTAAIAPDGQLMAVLPPFQTGALKVMAQGYTGLTPYSRFGNLPSLLLALMACWPGMLVWLRRRQK